MILDNKIIPDIFIKVSKHKEWLEDITQGKVYMNESGFFRKCDELGRGDPHEAQLFIDPYSIKINGITLTDVISEVPTVTTGFVNDDKYPMFCCTHVRSDMLVKYENYYKIRQDVIDELLKFGEYALVFYVYDFIPKLRRAIENSSLDYLCGSIKYIKKATTYKINDLYNPLFQEFNPFFIKDLDFQNQYEWRFVIFNNNGSSLLGDADNHYVLAMEPLEAFTIDSATKVLNGLTVHPNGDVVK